MNVVLITIWFHWLNEMPVFAIQKKSYTIAARFPQFLSISRGSELMSRYSRLPWFQRHCLSKDSHELHSTNKNSLTAVGGIEAPGSFGKKSKYCSYSTFRTTVTGVAAKLFQPERKHKMALLRDGLVWIDCEMTGLDIEKDLIMEVAVIITRADLEVVAQLDPLIIKTPEEILRTMDPWCIHHHGESGLTLSCQKSNLTTEEAENKILQFLQQYTIEGTCPMAGNSIYMDRMFLAKHMPKVNAHLHYRNVDVSTIKELSRRWFPIEFNKAPAKQYKHRTLSDIQESIEELKYYRTAVFKTAP